MTPFVEIPFESKIVLPSNVDSLNAEHSYDELPDLKAVTRAPIQRKEMKWRPSER
jgi:hypothetical protein